MIASLRSLLYRSGVLPIRKLPAYVVSVGNLSMGGTGKSPFAMLLAERAVAAGLRTAVLSRGYGRRSTGLKIVWPGEEVPPATEIGDEPRMLKLRVPGISLLVHPDRGRMALDRWHELGNPELVILDDAFQHWRLARNRDVVMIDAAEGLRGRTLPFGRMRESAEALARADLVVITRAKSLNQHQRELLGSEIQARLEPRAYAPWKADLVSRPAILWADYEFAQYTQLSGSNTLDVKDKQYVLVSGIAKPEGFRKLAQELGLKVKEELSFPDHHWLSDEDRRKILQACARLNGGYVLMTEKDWARWQDRIRGMAGIVVKVKLQFQGDGQSVFDQFMKNTIEEARRCSISG